MSEDNAASATNSTMKNFARALDEGLAREHPFQPGAEVHAAEFRRHRTWLKHNLAGSTAATNAMDCK